MTSHLDRKQIKRPDAFLEQANSLMRSIGDHSKTISAALALVFLLALGAALLNSFSERKTEAADSALFSAKNTLTQGLSKSKPKAPATPGMPGLPGQTPPVPPTTAQTPSVSWDEAVKPGLAALAKVTQDYPGTRAAFEAYLTIGDTYFEHGQFAQAIVPYQAAVEGAKPRSARPLALHALAYAFENEKKYNEAIEALRRILSSGDTSLKSDTTLALGRNFELLGDKPKALEQYKQVVKEFPNTAAAKAAEAGISHL